MSSQGAALVQVGGGMGSWEGQGLEETHSGCGMKEGGGDPSVARAPPPAYTQQEIKASVVLRLKT